MKKTLVALAALAATSAFAQSSVTISGNVDLGMQTTKSEGNNIAIPGAAKGDLSSKKVGGPIGNGAAGWTSSALGLDINEDLGNGTTAGYSVAIDLNSWATTNDTGAGTNQYFQNTRHSFLKLGNKDMGEVRLGYQYTLDDQIQGGVGRATPTGNIAGRIQNSALTIDPTQSAATATAPYREGYETISSGAFTRNNGIQYATPVMSGFQGLVQFAKQNSDTTDAGNAADGKATAKITAFAGKYSNGPLNLGLAHTKIISDANTAGAATTKAFKSDTKMTDLAANYDFGVAKVFANKFSRKTDITAGTFYDGTSANYVTTSAFGAFTDGGSVKRTGWDLGVSAPFGKATVFASMGRGKNKYDFDGATTASSLAEAKLKGKTLGVSYDLSKRTSLNAYYGQVKATSEDLFTRSAEFKKTQSGFGLRHQF